MREQIGLMNKNSQGQPHYSANPYEGHWAYVGPSGLQGLMHRVVFIEDMPAGDRMVYTWSAPISSHSRGGESWMGEWKEFLREFRRC